MHISYVIGKQDNKKGEFYLTQLKMSLLSLTDHHDKKSGLTINLIYEGLNVNDVKELRRLTKGYKLNLIPFPKERYKKELRTFNKINKYGLNVSVLYRLFMQELLNDDVDKVLHLDCDTIINKNLSSLFRRETKKDVMAARDVISPVIRDRRIKDYFNSGVFMLDLKSLRKKNFNLLNLSLKQLNKRNNLRWIDQDILNLVFENNKEIVPHNWFYMMMCPCDYVHPDKIHVLHTFMHNKSHYSNMHEDYKKIVNKYYKLVTGKDYVFNLTFKEKVKKNLLKYLPKRLIKILKLVRIK